MTTVGAQTMRRHVTLLVLAGAVTVTSACGGETTGSTGTGDAAVVEPSVEPSASEPTTTTGEPARTTAATAIPAEGEVVVVDTVEWAGVPGMRILGHGDQFVRLTTADGQLVMTGSDDGVNWVPVVTDLALNGVWVAASDGSVLHVGGWATVGAGFVFAASSDDGATWTTNELPVSDPGLPYVHALPNVAAVAAGDGTAVAVGMVNHDVDWQTYSIEQLGVDHGQMDGMGSADGGAPGQVTVRFADGFELTVDAAEFGLDSMFAGAGPVTVAWVWDGTAWEQTSPPFGSFSGQPTIAFGPAGYVALGPPNVPTAGPVELHAFRSLDGRTWHDTPLPATLSSDMPSLVGGPLGYVIVGSDVVYHSIDAITWTEVHRFDDPDPQSSGYTNPQYVAAGGPTGFLVPIAEPEPTPDQPPLVLSSPDGVTWDEVPMPAGTHNAFVALDNQAGVVIPVIIDQSMATPRADFPDDESLHTAIVDNFTVPRPLVTTGEAQCIADGLIAEFGRQRLQELGFGTAPWHLLGYALSLGPFDRSDSELIVDTFRRCSTTWERLMITSVTEGTDQISDESAACVADVVPDDEARDLFVLELDRPYDDGDGDLSHLARLVETYQRCLTPEEFDRLDFD